MADRPYPVTDLGTPSQPSRLCGTLRNRKVINTKVGR